MTSADTQRQIESVQRELDRLHREVSEVSRQEANKADSIAKVTNRLVTEKSSSIVAMKQRDLRNWQQDIARLQSKRADITRKIANRTAELHRLQKSLFQQQTTEQSNAIARLARDQMKHREAARGLLRTAATVASPPGGFDAFISHATEDKDELVRPLAELLTASGYAIWYDEFQLKVGDSLRRSIDRGLTQSRFGIVVLSPSFFAKNWPQYELDGLVAREQSGGKVILPLWHKVSKNEVLGYSPSLADKLALSTATYTIEELVRELSAVLGEKSSG